MSKVTLFDGTEFFINQRQTDMLKESINKSTEGFITVEGKTVKKNAISSIIPGGITELDRIFGLDRQVSSGKVCRGEKSIQREINNVIKQTYPNDWAKKIASKKGREAIRLKLLTKNAEWCDAKERTCHCS